MFYLRSRIVHQSSVTHPAIGTATSIAQVPSQPQLTRSEIASAILFIPFALWVLWASWKWRKDYQQLRRERHDLP